MDHKSKQPLKRAIVFAPVAITLGIGIAIWMAIPKDPGMDASLNSLSQLQIVDQLGEPFDVVFVRVEELENPDIRQICSKAGLSNDQEVMIMRWFRNESGSRSAVCLTAWLHWAADNWVVFYNYRKYKWAGL